MSVSARVSASPLSSIAWPSPKLAAITTIDVEVHRVAGLGGRQDAAAPPPRRRPGGRPAGCPGRPVPARGPAARRSPGRPRGAFSSRGGPSPPSGAISRKSRRSRARGAEGGPGEHQQDVAGAQAHLAELALDALAGAVDRDHRPAVAAAEARPRCSVLPTSAGPAARPPPRRGAARCAEPTAPKWRSCTETSPRMLLQVQDPGDVAGEGQPVPGGQHLVRPHRRDPVAVGAPPPRGRRPAGCAGRPRPRCAPRSPASAVTSISTVNSLASSSALSLGRGARAAGRGVSDEHHRDPRDHGERQPDGADLEDPHRLLAGVLDQPRDHQVRGGADQRHGAADHRGEADAASGSGRASGRCAGTRPAPGGIAIATIGVLLRNAEAEAVGTTIRASAPRSPGSRVRRARARASRRAAAPAPACAPPPPRQRRARRR